MDSHLSDLLLRPGWKLPFLRLFSSRKTVILLYHGIPKRGDVTNIDGTEFERQVLFLKQHFEVVSANRLGETRKGQDRIRVLLTFYDVFRNHAEVVAPILRKHDLPAIFFVSSRHSVPGKYLWFTYLRALERHFFGDGFSFCGEF